MDDNVVPFTGTTRLDTPPDGVIDGAKEADLRGVVIVGYAGDGEEFYFASSYADSGSTLWLLAMAQKQLLDMAIEDE